jgi:Aerotolerance regulator N-terminal
MPILGVPLALIGLTALPALTAIYWLRTRFRRQEVSSLFLWSLAAKAHGGGRRATRLQTPLLWLLELLALLLLALAAAGPRIPRADRAVPVMVVLDDSFSMTATHGDGRSTRQAGVDAIRKELGALGPFAARFVVAGPQPALIGGAVSRIADVDQALEGWRCESASSSIGPAVALAREVGGPTSRVLVVTDRAQPSDPSPTGADPQGDRLRWHAIGQAGPNVGIVNAVRSADPQRDQVLIEVSNFDDEPRTVTLILSAGSDQEAFTHAQRIDPVGTTRVIDRRTLELAGGETRRLRLAPKTMGEVLIAEVDADALAADNRVVLMPPGREPLPVSVSITDPTLSKAVRSAVRASGLAKVTSGRASLVFTDRAQPAPAASPAAVATGTHTGGATPSTPTRPWRVQFDVPPAEDIDAYLGPFVIDFTHPLTAGLSLTGLVWSAPAADADPSSTGRPIVSAGDVPLISERDLPGGAKALNIRLRADRSTLLTSAAWPVLIANTIDWRRAELPGLSHVNARPGLPVTLNLPAPADHVSVTRFAPGDETQIDPPTDVEVRSGAAVLTADRPGVYLVSAGDKHHRFAVNTMSAEESDLRASATGVYGLWNDERALRTDYRGLGWILGLAALALLAAHAWLLYRPRAQGIGVLKEGTA